MLFTRVCLCVCLCAGVLQSGGGLLSVWDTNLSLSAIRLTVMSSMANCPHPLTEWVRAQTLPIQERTASSSQYALLISASSSLPPGHAPPSRNSHDPRFFLKHSSIWFIIKEYEVYDELSLFYFQQWMKKNTHEQR